MGVPRFVIAAALLLSRMAEAWPLQRHFGFLQARDGNATRRSATAVAEAGSASSAVNVEDLRRMSHLLRRSHINTTGAENPKCEKLCEADSSKEECHDTCEKLQKKVCTWDFSCSKGCGNENRYLEKDVECETICLDVQQAVCYPFHASGEDVSPTVDNRTLPSIAATPPPRISMGSFLLCNLYPSKYRFEVLSMDEGAQDGSVLAKLGYEECDRLTMESDRAVGVRAEGRFAAIAPPLHKIPFMMVFGRWSRDSPEVSFNWYFAQGGGPAICNGFPLWERDRKDVAEPVELFRGGYNGTALAQLRYNQCIATNLNNGDIIAAKIQGHEAAQHTVVTRSAVILLGKVGGSTAVSFEAVSTDGSHL